MTHRFQSIEGAVRRVRQLERQVNELLNLSGQINEERFLMARLAADEPQFYNPLHVIEAKKIRDRILKSTR